jgi:hypothetical protein
MTHMTATRVRVERPQTQCQGTTGVNVSPTPRTSTFAWLALQLAPQRRVAQFTLARASPPNGRQRLGDLRPAKDDVHLLAADPKRNDLLMQRLKDTIPQRKHHSDRTTKRRGDPPEREISPARETVSPTLPEEHSYEVEIVVGSGKARVIRRPRAKAPSKAKSKHLRALYVDERC